MKKLIILASVFAASTACAQTTISDARSQSVGQVVTVSGVVTNGSELGIIRYLQDGTAGIAAYGGSVGTINRYDSITVTGPLSEFNGLLEIGGSATPTYINHGTANVIPQPLNVPINSINESLEGQLVVLNNVTFVSSGTFASGNSTVQVTDGSINFDIRINGSTDIDGASIPSGAMSITGLVGQFNSNYQIIPRDLNDIVAYTPPSQEINILVEGNTEFSGNTVYLGATTSANITIENLGVGNLNIASATFSGSQAAAFSSDIITGDLAPSSTNPFTININPTTIGTQEATLTIVSDDADETNYIIHFQAGGTDGLATEPSASPTAFNVTFNKAYKISADYTGVANTESYLVLWSNGGAVSGTPVDGTSYLRGDVIGNARVAYVGSATSFTPRGVIANQDYHFAIYAYNGQNGIENYAPNPLVANLTSGGEEIGTYYNGIDVDASTFAADLQAIVQPHTMISYYSYLLTMISEFAIRDTTGGQSYVECVYSGEKIPFSGPFNWTAQDYSREHVFAHSWMPGNPYNNPEAAPYTDQHNLFPTQFSLVNQNRSNMPFGEVVNVSYTYLNVKSGTDANGDLVWEPQDKIKGDVARALMYQAVTYNGTNGTWAFPSFIGTIFPYGQDASVIKQWHFQDPPDAYEIARNEYIYSIQGNRNPFIDSVDFACYIDFSSMDYDPTICDGLGLNEVIETNDVFVFPVPASNELKVAVNNSMIKNYELIDIHGRTVYTAKDVNKQHATLNVSGLKTGTYLIKINTANGLVTKRVIIS